MTRATASRATSRYQRHRPERTLLYQLVERHYPAFVEHLAEAGKQLPGHVRQAFDGYLQSSGLLPQLLVEWSERGGKRLPAADLELSIEFAGSGRRILMRNPGADLIHHS